MPFLSSTVCRTRSFGSVPEAVLYSVASLRERLYLTSPETVEIQMSFRESWNRSVTVPSPESGRLTGTKSPEESSSIIGRLSAPAQTFMRESTIRVRTFPIFQLFIVPSRPMRSTPEGPATQMFPFPSSQMSATWSDDRRYRLPAAEE